MRGGVFSERPTKTGRSCQWGGGGGGKREQNVFAVVAGAGRVEIGDGGAVAVYHVELSADSADTAEAISEASQNTRGSRHDVFCYS